MDLSMFIIDAFTERPLAGNPAAVCPLEAWLPTSTMQAMDALAARSPDDSIW